MLVNAGGQYELARTPVVSMVNHVMNYLPDWDMYVDATAKEVPFGYLPGGSYSKQVLHVGRAKALALVPGFDHTRNRQQVEMTLKIGENGSASGTMHAKITGPQAATVRAYMRELQGQSERDFVKSALSMSGLRGRGSLERGSTEGLSDEFEFSVKFDIDNLVRTRSGTLYLSSSLPTPMPVMNFVGFEDRPPPKRRQLCWGFHSTEKLEIDIPAGMELLTLPTDAQFRGQLVDFDAHYVRNGSHLSVTRSLDDKTPGSVCSAALFTEFLRQAVPVSEHLRIQVLFKRN